MRCSAFEPHRRGGRDRSCTCTWSFCRRPRFSFATRPDFGGGCASRTRKTAFAACLVSSEVGLPHAQTLPLAPTLGFPPKSPPYERGVLVLDEAGEFPEPVVGVAPTSSAYRAEVLRLNETGQLSVAPRKMEPEAGIEPALPLYRRGGLPLSDPGMEGAAGVAPALSGPRPDVQSCYTSPPCTPLDLHQRSALIERVSCYWTRSAWSG